MTQVTRVDGGEVTTPETTVSGELAEVLDAYQHEFEPLTTNTDERIRQVLNRRLERMNEEPAPVEPWQCRIGASKFFIPPTNISVNKSFKAGSMRGGAIRQQSTPKFNSGHTETTIEMTLFFPNYEQIWGYDKNVFEIDFDNDSAERIDSFLSSLRGLVTQFRYMPILPVRNNYLNRAHNITGVALRDLSVSSVPDFPFVIAANLSMLKFNHQVYMPMIEHFDQAVHWGRLRQYAGRAAWHLSEGQRPVVTFGGNEQINRTTLEEEDFRPSIRTAEDVLSDLQEDVTTEFEYARKSFGEVRGVDFYYPFHTPRHVDLPDVEDIRPWEAPEEETRALWGRALELLGLDVGRAEAELERAREIAEGQGFDGPGGSNEFQELLDWMQALNTSMEQMTSAQLSEYIDRRLDELDIEPGTREAAEVANQIRGVWYAQVYKGIMEDPSFARALAFDRERRQEMAIREWEVPMLKLNLDPDTVLVDGISVMIGNQFAPMQLQMEAEPTYQHIGGRDSHIEVSLTVVGPQADAELVKLRSMFDSVSGIARLNHGHGVLGFLGIQNVLTELLGIRYVMPTAFNVDTVPEFPGTYKVRLALTDFDVFQQKREMLSLEQQAELVEAFGKRNPFLRIKQLWGCVDEETEILTSHGWLTHDRLAAGMEVLTLNHETGFSEWQVCQHVNRYEVDTNLLYMENKVHSSATSHNHRWPVLSRDYDSGDRTRQWATSEELNSTNYLILSAPSADIPQEAKYKDSLVELVAWLWTEGHIEYRDGRKSPRVSLSQSIDVNPQYVDRIRRCLTDLFGPPSGSFGTGRDRLGTPLWRETARRDRPEMVDFKLNSDAADVVVDLLPDRVVSTDFVRSLTSAQLDLFVNVSIWADGHRRGADGPAVVSQSSKARLESLELACALLGYNTSLTEKNFTYNGQPWSRWDLSIRTTTTYNVPSKKDQVWRHYTGTIWCPTTENSSWFARRSGKTFFTGNSFNAYPEFPLAVRDDDGNVVGQLEPDYFYRHFKTIDDDLTEYEVPGVESDDAEDGPRSNYGDSSTVSEHVGDYNDDGLKIALGEFGDVSEYIAPGPGGFSIVDGNNNVAAANVRHYDETAADLHTKPFVEGLSPASRYAAPNFSRNDPSSQFHAMVKDEQYRDKDGRMIRAFPTYMLWLIDEGGHFAGVRLFDNFYGLQSVLDFSVLQSEDVVGDTLIMNVSNLYSRLSTEMRDYVDEDRFGGRIINETTQRLQSILTGLHEYLMDLDSLVLRPGVRVHLRAGYGCADVDTEILTENGWKTYQQVSEGDLVLTLNHETGMSEWKPVQQMNIYEVENEELVSIEGKFHSSLTTQDHSWPILHSVKTPAGDEWQKDWTNSKSLQTNDKIILAAPSSDIPIEPSWSDEFVELLSWFWTEGSVSGDRRNRVTIYQSQEVNPDYCDRIRTALTKLFGPPVTHLGNGGRHSSATPAWRERERNDRPGVLEFALNVPAGKELLAVAPDKVVPLEFVKQLTRHQLKLFVDVAFCADDRNSRLIGQAVPERLDALELACTLLGRRVKRYDRYDSANEYQEYLLYAGEVETLGFSEGRPNQTQTYSGVVWCPTTSNGTWFARRNGTTYFTGNSNPNKLETLFNGTITDVQYGETMQITAQSDGAVELTGYVNTADPEEHSGDIDGTFFGMYMSEPRDLMLALLTRGESKTREFIAHATRDMIFSDNRYGIKHFGTMLYEPMTQAEVDNTENRRQALSQHFATIAGKERNATGNVVSMFNINIIDTVQTMQRNLAARRDYEVFKRNIYPGNGLGIAQYAGGDLGDIGLYEAMDGSEIMTAGTGIDPNEHGQVPEYSPRRDPREMLREAVQEEGLDDFDPDDLTDYQTNVMTWLPWGQGYMPNNAAAGIFRNTLKGLGLTHRYDGDEIIDEVSFRAETYMRTVWDLFQLCAALLPDYIVAVRPFEERSTIFYGKPHWLYTSGVIPLTSGTRPESGPDVVEPDEEMQKETRRIEQQMDQRDNVEPFEQMFDNVARMTQEGDPSNYNTSQTSQTSSGHTSSGERLDYSESDASIQYWNTVDLDAARSNGDYTFIPQVASEAGFPDDKLVIMTAIAFAESGGDPSIDNGGMNANGTTDHGLWQINDGVWDFDPNQIYNPLYNAKWARTVYQEQGLGAWVVYNTGAYRDELDRAEEVVRDWRNRGTQPGPVSGDRDVSEGGWESELRDREEQVDTTGHPATGQMDPQPNTDWMDEVAVDEKAQHAFEHGWQDDDIPVNMHSDDVDDIVGKHAAKLYEEERSEETANEIWHDFRNHFNSDNTELREAIKSSPLLRELDEEERTSVAESQVEELAEEFVRFCWQNPAARGWVVRVADRRLDYFAWFEDVIEDYQDGPGFVESMTATTQRGVGNMMPVLSRMVAPGILDETADDVGEELVEDAEGDPGVTDWGSHLLGVAGGAASSGWDWITDGEDARRWSFTNVYDAFVQFLVGGPDGALEYMRSNPNPGRSSSSVMGRAMETIGSGVMSAWDSMQEVWGSVTQSFGAIINIIRLQFGELGGLLGSLGQKREISSVINKVHNDSLYYTAGLGENGEVQNELLNLADNPFTREYGEPVVEIREPFQRVHTLSSFQHIIANHIQASSDDVATVVTATTDGKEPVTVHFDKSVPSEKQQEMAVETGLVWDEDEGWLSSINNIAGGPASANPMAALRGIHNIVGRLGYGRKGDGVTTETSAKRIASWHLKESLKDIYRGEIIIVGKPDIRPHDLIYIADIYEGINGFVECEQVIHHFTPDGGFVTSVTPNAVVSINDPARFTMAAHWRGEKNLQEIRNHIRKSVNTENTPVSGDEPLDMESVKDEVENELLGSLQFTGGKAALVRSIATMPGAQAVAAQVNIGTLGLASLAWGYIRDNLLDQHACYINYLTHRGEPMDAGLTAVYQSNAVGMRHGASIIAGALRLGPIPFLGPDESPMIRTGDLIDRIQWDEYGPNDAAQQISSFVDSVNRRVFEVGGRSPDGIPGQVNEVYIGTVENVSYPDQLAFSVSDHLTDDEVDSGSGSLAGSRFSVSLANVALPDAALDLEPFADERGLRTLQFIESRVLGRSVALRVVPHTRDDDGQINAYVFHNAPEGLSDEDRNEFLAAAAGGWPEVAWDSYMEDGQPYTLNWEVVAAGHARLDVDLYEHTLPGRGLDPDYPLLDQQEN